MQPERNDLDNIRPTGESQHKRADYQSTLTITALEHWYDDESSSVFEKSRREKNLRLLMGTPVKCCEIEGESWEDCMRKYHEHMGWEAYVPMFPTELEKRNE